MYIPIMETENSYGFSVFVMGNHFVLESHDGESNWIDVEQASKLIPILQHFVATGELLQS